MTKEMKRLYWALEDLVISLETTLARGSIDKDMVKQDIIAGRKALAQARGEGQ